MKKIEDLITICNDRNFSYAFFRLPRQKDFHIIIQTTPVKEFNPALELSTASGFVFAPFNADKRHKAYMIVPDHFIAGQSLSGTLIQDLSSLKALDSPSFVPDNIHTASKEEFIENVETIRACIKNGEFKKAILSRAEEIVRPEHFTPGEMFTALCRKYHYSFISLVHIPGAGTWAGASPELLLGMNDKYLTLVSLAATRRALEHNNTVNWSEKELKEQQIVTDFIADLLEEFRIRSYSKSPTESSRAGNLYHLKTTFSIPNHLLNGKTSSFIRRLHPTPAIWGQPRNGALDIIRRLEKHNREYYAGYLGPVNLDGIFEIYVNIRTMKILNDRLVLYIGNGITEDSDAAAEWEETCIKANTLLSVIERL